MESRDTAGEEQPFYVNAKQYHRILKRRIARAKLEESLRSTPGRRPYLHESRHKHAMRRPRGQGGRFLTAAEIAEQQRQKENGEAQNSDTPANTDSPAGEATQRVGESRTDSADATPDSAQSIPKEEFARDALHESTQVPRDNDAFQYTVGINPPMQDMGAPLKSN